MRGLVAFLLHYLKVWIIVLNKNMLLCILGRDKGKDYGRNRKVFVESSKEVSNNGTKYYMQHV